jgi:hypothetical protein
MRHITQKGGKMSFLSKFVLALSLTICSFQSFCANDNKEIKLNSIAETVAKGVEKVSNVNAGESNRTLFILDETHISRVAQIQHAIALTRLHDKYNLKQIALEGYFVEQPPISTNWYASAAQKDCKARVGVAVNLLKEGEISEAEFIKLVYDDVTLVPVEKKVEHTLKPPEGSGEALNSYLQAIAQANSGLVEWVNKEVKNLNIALDPKNMDMEAYLIILNEIVSNAEKNGVVIDTPSKKAMEETIAFVGQRVKASKTMLESINNPRNGDNSSTIAMIIGKAHTKGMVKQLRKKNETLVVLTPFCVVQNDTTGDLTGDMLTRKMDVLSVYTEGYKKQLHDIFNGLAKPGVVLFEPWLQGEAELSLFTDRIARSLLGPTNASGGAKPPFGFNNTDFNGNWVRIPPDEIKIVPDDENGKSKAILFPAYLKHKDSKDEVKVFVKAGLNSDKVNEKEKTIEELLVEALGEVRAEGKPNLKVEDNAGRTQITKCTRVAISLNPESLKMVKVSS